MEETMNIESVKLKTGTYSMAYSLGSRPYLLLEIAFQGSRYVRSC